MDLKREPKTNLINIHISSIFLILFFVLSENSAAQKSTIYFEKNGWKQALKKAKKENKLIFLDCYTTWCGPCRWMKSNVFTNDSVASFFNANFISVQIDMEKGEGIDFAKKHNITAYPTMLYLSPEAEILHRTCGKVNTKTFIEDGKNAMNPKKQLKTYTKLYNDSLNDKIAFQYFQLLERAGILYTTTIESYLSKQSEQNLVSLYNWKIIYNYTNFDSKYFHFLASHINEFAHKYNRDSVEEKVNKEYSRKLLNERQKGNQTKFENLKIDFRKLKTKGCEQIIEEIEVRMIKLPHADKKNAIQITDSIIGPTNVSYGCGATMEYKFRDPGSLNNHISYEENSAWYKLKIDHDTLLTFDIVPLDSTDDYDFAVFKAIPEKINNTSELKLQRLCYSYCKSRSGITGLSSYSKEKVIGCGFGPAYTSAIKVTAGETYYILVQCFNSAIKYNNNKWPMGFTMYFHNYWPKRKPIILNNVNFESDKTTISKEALSELDKLAASLKNKYTRIEIRGHSDNSGNEERNLILSEERAKFIADYLISKSIASERVFYKGFGSTLPIASNNNEEGRQLNRRAEFVIVMN